MSAEPLFEVERPTPPKLSESVVADLLRQRHAHPGNGGSGRFVFARQVRSDSGFAGERTDDTGNVSTLRTFDAVAIGLWQSSRHAVHVFEIKVSRSDWLRELADPDKTAAALAIAEYFWIVAPAGIVKLTELGDGWGLIEVHGDGDAKPWRMRATKRATALRPPSTTLPRGFVTALLRAVPGAVPGARNDHPRPITEGNNPQ